MKFIDHLLVLFSLLHRVNLDVLQVPWSDMKTLVASSRECIHSFTMLWLLLNGISSLSLLNDNDGHDNTTTSVDAVVNVHLFPVPCDKENTFSKIFFIKSQYEKKNVKVTERSSVLYNLVAKEKHSSIPRLIYFTYNNNNNNNNNSNNNNNNNNKSSNNNKKNYLNERNLWSLCTKQRFIIKSRIIENILLHSLLNNKLLVTATVNRDMSKR
uniref:Uncharacterized protein n=1 Tax=Glossina austeni TaxID=7395 RepID=A0A1A9UUC4_GLOAU